MSSDLSLEEWNFQVIMLVQALVGAISKNFRMVALCYNEPDWILSFYLEKDFDEDLEEIEDIVCQYTAYQDIGLRCKYEIVIGAQSLPAFSDVGRVVYRRRE
ncbi:hypothetical protein NK553_04125 [Pseudomonas sp. ZM23]|uniref:CdiI n=1 Tax=Pseudomonas triclosanedens TaxID=2961893 RepID=A0ABY6ZUN8_9PSED|nr:hypothetical protein [Pseudomonas triclosanedens]MCP8463128.1 hypothetical protein [Pseudomonas triclosanedens]MCP8469813.1 hypothetical protein [Pseudomonas triclosanedens]MCP8473929.1 hypothetical protein [Pseudomonas triclosanedens]WAI48672.1 hypothetical protein OU419_23375 [Pseudomonas triclosanedens]